MGNGFVSGAPDDVSVAGFPPDSLRGLIEGFYGPPWTWDERLDVMAFCAEWGMTHYIHAPKDDPLHRAEWRTPWGDEHLEGYARLVAAGTLEVGVAISPGLSIDVDRAADVTQLAAKVDQVLDLGVRLVALCLDDLPPRAGLGADHARLTNALARHIADRARVVLVPTDYTSTTPTPYLDALAAGLDTGIDVAWTGPGVVNDRITVASAVARAAVVGGRPPLVWDNYPVNDAVMADRLFTGPLRGREPALQGVCSGWLANPGVQARASLPALASIAAWCAGGDPRAAWDDLLGGAFRRSAVFCAACDGEVPAGLVDDVITSWGSPAGRGALDTLDGWLAEAEGADAPDLGAGVSPWVEQVRAEAAVGRAAVSVLRLVLAGGDVGSSSVGPAFVLASGWMAARRATVTVFGPRLALRPTMGQRGEGTWVWREGAVLIDGNAIDRLARFAVTRLDAAVGGAVSDAVPGEAAGAPAAGGATPA